MNSGAKKEWRRGKGEKKRGGKVSLEQIAANHCFATKKREGRKRKAPEYSVKFRKEEGKKRGGRSQPANYPYFNF